MREGLATDDTIRVEPAGAVEEWHPQRTQRVWKRLGADPTLTDEDAAQFAEGVRRGSQLLVVKDVDRQHADRVRQILRETGAADIRRRMKRWWAEGWRGFDPSSLTLTEQEIVEERNRCIDDDAVQRARLTQVDPPDRSVRLLEENTGREIGHISEDELRVLQEQFEQEDPDDRDFWINPHEIDDIQCHPGATPHLVALLRNAVGGNPDGIDIAFGRP